MADSSRSASNNGTRTTTPKVAADGGSIVPAGATGRRPSMHPANPRETDIATTKRAVPVGDPLPQTSHLPAIGEPTAAPSRGAVGSAVARSRENIDDQGQESDKTLEKPGLSDDFFYDKATFKASGVSAKQIPFDSLHLFYCFGFESTRRNNLHYVNEHIIATIVGNVLVFLNLRTMDQDYLAGLRDGAIGSIAVHPSRKYIAVAEVFDDEPNIYMFEYPSLQLYRVLRQGAEKGFSNVCFNTEGDKLASVGMDPDYMLTIWDWKQEKIVLRSKAFSQDVYNVAFSPETDGQLTTAGMGHIKFWRMASTFTGLKLQGYIGKFGLTELTDISTFVQLPDGKVLSSTDTGNLLLWDGGMIKCEIAGKGRKPCHQGKVEVVTLLDGEIITAGEDGYIRVWDFETIDTADVVTTGSAGSQGGAPDAGAPTNSVAQARVFEMEPIDEILVGKDVKVGVNNFGQGNPGVKSKVDQIHGSYTRNDNRVFGTRSSGSLVPSRYAKALDGEAALFPFWSGSRGGY
ncbi:WD40-repeat-containing domain protein [Phlyctochytrium arcticum]|nr:WD40-repeat-containing domain protein [Phlyctochytrium arcticum]